MRSALEEGEALRSVLRLDELAREEESASEGGPEDEQLEQRWDSDLDLRRGDPDQPARSKHSKDRPRLLAGLRDAGCDSAASEHDAWRSESAAREARRRRHGSPGVTARARFLRGRRTEIDRIPLLWTTGRQLRE